MKNNKELLAAIELEKQKAAGVKSSVKDWLKLNKPGRVTEYDEERMFQIQTNGTLIGIGVTGATLDFGDIDFDTNILVTGIAVKVITIDDTSGIIRQIHNACVIDLFTNNGDVNNLRPSGVTTFPNASIQKYQRFAFGPSCDRMDCSIRYESGMPQMGWAGNARFTTPGVADEMVIGTLSIYFKLRP